MKVFVCHPHFLSCMNFLYILLVSVSILLEKLITQNIQMCYKISLWWSPTELGEEACRGCLHTANWGFSPRSGVHCRIRRPVGLPRKAEEFTPQGRRVLQLKSALESKRQHPSRKLRLNLLWRNGSPSSCPFWPFQALSSSRVGPLHPRV